MSTLQKYDTTKHLFYLGRIWILLAVTMIVFNEWDQYGYYHRTVLFTYIQVFGVYISPIEALVVLCAIPFFPHITKLLITKCLLRHPVISVLIFFDFGMGMVTGYNRMGKLVGLAEIKAFFLLGICIYISRKAMENGAFSRAIPLLCWASILHSLVDFYQYWTNPIIDNTLGEKTPVSFISCMLLPAFVTGLIERKGRERVPYYICIAVILVDVYLSQSRALAVISIGGVLLTYRFCKLQITRPKVRITNFILATIVILLVLLIVISPLLLRGSEFIRSFMFWESQADQGHNLSNMSHYYDIQRGIQMISESPITGLGFGGDLTALGTATFDVIHNEFLHFWVLFGIGGAVLWIYLFVALPIQFMRRLDRARLEGYRMRDEHYLIFSFIGSIAVHALVYPSFFLFVPFLWIYGIWFASITSIKATRDVPVRSPSKARCRISPPSPEVC